MSFTKKSLRFLEENHARNSKDWFAEHRDEYRKHVEAPMLGLAGALIPTVLDIDPLLIVEPKRTLSKIYRDTRFSRDKTLFKRASWFLFQRSKGMVHPVWFFEFTPDFYRYGCGYYAAPSKVMTRMRELVMAGDKRYHAAQKALDALPHISLEGEKYKRPRHPQATLKQREWVDRKSITAMHTSTDMECLLKGNLAARIREDFLALAPIYHFMIDIHEACHAVPKLDEFGYGDAPDFV